MIEEKLFFCVYETNNGLLTLLVRIAGGSESVLYMHQSREPEVIAKCIWDLPDDKNFDYLPANELGNLDPDDFCNDDIIVNSDTSYWGDAGETGKLLLDMLENGAPTHNRLRFLDVVKARRARSKQRKVLEEKIKNLALNLGEYCKKSLNIDAVLNVNGAKMSMSWAHNFYYNGISFFNLSDDDFYLVLGFLPDFLRRLCPDMQEALQSDIKTCERQTTRYNVAQRYVDALLDGRNISEVEAAERNLLTDTTVN